MNNCERFHATMHYQPRDRSPILDFGFWRETLVVWHNQGLPRYVGASDEHRLFHPFFGMDFQLRRADESTGVKVGLVPPFVEKIIEDWGEYEVVQQDDGVRVLRKKFMRSIPKHLGHLLVDRASWQKYYRPRLDPSHPARYPPDWDSRAKAWTDPDLEDPLILPGGSLYGWLRNWMGLENISYVVYDDPAWFEEMVTTIADCVIGTLTCILETGGHFAACMLWEDMCY